MTTLRLILGDQLSRSISTLRDIDRANDLVLMVEVDDEATYVPHHKQKIVLVLAAMRHFAAELRAAGINVAYVQLDDPANTGSFTGELERALARFRADRIVVTEPGEWRVYEMMLRWEETFGLPVEIRQDNRFLCTLDRFAAWAKGRKSLRMEYFYREMRRQTGWLMTGEKQDKPIGERWNYDAENRKKLPKSIQLPARERFKPDETTQAVIELVDSRYRSHFGTLADFGWAVTRADALKALDHFVADCLPTFGDYQDAMQVGEGFLFHSVLSPYINIGLLLPREVCLAALAAYEADAAPIHAVEGFIRQILGWREYVRGLYWLKMPGYRDSNYLDANRPLPTFYWSGDTDLNCIKDVVATTQKYAYAHHIQRLMITGNFALLAGIDPAAVEAWYLIVYADAFEWVELPNTHGMALHADGGLLGSKPYAASGAYINRMSNYCKGCRFDPKLKLGPDACPFNYLYWYFLIVNRDKLANNPRMGMPYRNLAKMSEAHRQNIVTDAENFLNGLSNSNVNEWAVHQDRDKK